MADKHPKHGDPLSKREIQCLALRAEGYSNSKAGEHLDIAGSTVKTHIRRATIKLGANDTAHAVFLAMRQGLVF